MCRITYIKGNARRHIPRNITLVGLTTIGSRATRDITVNAPNPFPLQQGIIGLGVVNSNRRYFITAKFSNGYNQVRFLMENQIKHLIV